MKTHNTYPNIDMEKTGRLLRQLIMKQGYKVKDIQSKLLLESPQPVYRWFKGQILPSVDHLLMLSMLLGVHMEELLVLKKNPVPQAMDDRENKKRQLYERLRMYHEKLCPNAA